MSEVYKSLKDAQARTSGQVTAPKSGAKTESRVTTAPVVSEKSDSSNRTLERVALGLAIFIMLILAVSISIVSTGVSALKKSLANTDAAVGALALKADTMRESLKDAGAELVSLKDDTTRTQEAVAGLERGLESINTRQTVLAGRIDKLENSLQSAATSSAAMEQKPVKNPSSESQQTPQQ